MTAVTPDVAFVDLDAQLRSVRAEIDAAIRGVIDNGSFILGPEVEQFEAEFAEYCDARHAVGVDSGTSALELALRALDVGPDDEVITISNSFVASALAIVHAGARPVLVDPDPATRNMSAETVERAITPRTKVLLPVHMYGQPTDMEPLRTLADAHGLAIVEDACQAHGARYRGVRAGSLGDAAAFSFYPAKNLGALGDGGAVVTSDDGIAKRLRLLRNYGHAVKNNSTSVGYNKRLDEVQAAVLRVKLRHLDDWNSARREVAQVYDKLLGPVDGITTPAPPADVESVHHLYVVNVDDRDAIRRQLGDEGISTGIHYPIAIHRQPAFDHLGYEDGSLPVAERLTATNVSLPMFAELEPLDAERVAAALGRAHAALPQSDRS